MVEALAIVLAVILFIVLLSVLGVGLAVWLSARTLNRRNRVSPTAPSPAPLTWLGAPSAAARLHRRLRSAVAVARASSAVTATTAPHLSELAEDLERQAVLLDSHLALVARLAPQERRTRMAALGQEVRKVEQVASQVSMMAAQTRAPLLGAGQHSALDDLSEKLDVLEAARGEVADVESAAGLRRTSPYATGTSLPHPGT